MEEEEDAAAAAAWREAERVTRVVRAVPPDSARARREPDPMAGVLSEGAAATSVVEGVVAEGRLGVVIMRFWNSRYLASRWSRGWALRAIPIEYISSKTDGCPFQTEALSLHARLSQQAPLHDRRWRTKNPQVPILCRPLKGVLGVL